MQVFKTFFRIMKKNIISIMIYSGMFIFFAIAYTSNIKVENEQFKPSKVNIMVLNEDGQSTLVDGFMKYLGEYVNFVEPDKDEDSRKNKMFFRKMVYILTIPEGFSEQFAKEGTAKFTKQTVPDSVEVMSIDNVIDNYFNVAKNYVKYAPELDYNKMNAYIENCLKDETKVNLNIEVKDDVTYSNGFNSNFFNFLGYIIIASLITGVSMNVFSFNGVDILRRHTASPLTRRKFNMQLIFANFIFVVAYLLIFIIVGYALNKSRMINANTILVWLNAFAFSLTALSISYLIGITVKSRKAVGAFSTGLSLSLAFISGLFVPQKYLGTTVLKIASFTPTYWYAKANNALMNVTSFRWSETSNIFGYMAIQVGFTIALISIALVVSKRKRQQTY